MSPHCSWILRIKLHVLLWQARQWLEILITRVSRGRHAITVAAIMHCVALSVLGEAGVALDAEQAGNSFCSFEVIVRRLGPRTSGTAKKD